MDPGSLEALEQAPAILIQRRVKQHKMLVIWDIMGTGWGIIVS